MNAFRLLSGILKVIRWIVVLAMGALGVVFGTDLLLNSGLVNSRELEGFTVIRLVRSTSEPVVAALDDVLSFRTVIELRTKPRIQIGLKPQTPGGFRPKGHDTGQGSSTIEVELIPLIIAVILYVMAKFLSRQALQLAAVMDAEYQLRLLRARRAQNESVEGLTFSSTSTDKRGRGLWGHILRRKEAERDRLLREFSEAKKRLEKTKQWLAFLSIDIVGSTRIKLGQDPLAAERAFREYRYFLEQIFKKYRYRVASWTPDGIMVCFPQVDLACGAAKELLTRLPAFNSDKNPLQFPIQVRCGLNAGEVYYDESTPLELLSDRVLDITGHLQKAARPDSLLVTEGIYKQLYDRKGFAMAGTDLDGYRVFEWSQVHVSPAPKC